MAKLSGVWTIEAIAKRAAWDQRLLIAGSINSDGAHPMVQGTVIANVQGMDVEITPQALDPGKGQWRESLQQELMSWHPTKGVVVTIFADDVSATADHDFDDLIVECTSTDDQLTPPPFQGPRLDLTIPRRLFEHKFHQVKQRN